MPTNSAMPLRLANDVWCQTCRHEHIAYIPATTFLCAACGFGSWSEDVAESHATDLPTHIVYPVVHEVVALNFDECYE